LAGKSYGSISKYIFFQMELKLENDRQREVSDIAQEQVRNLELWKLSQEYQLDYMRRQILELQSTSDERSIIGKDSHYCSANSVGPRLLDLPHFQASLGSKMCVYMLACFIVEVTSVCLSVTSI
jgi:hypothetical protein